MEPGKDVRAAARPHSNFTFVNTPAAPAANKGGVKLSSNLSRPRLPARGGLAAPRSRRRRARLASEASAKEVTQRRTPCSIIRTDVGAASQPLKPAGSEALTRFNCRRARVPDSPSLRICAELSAARSSPRIRQRSAAIQSPACASARKSLGWIPTQPREWR